MSADYHNVYDQTVFPELDFRNAILHSFSCTLLLKMPLWKNMICFLTIHSFSSVQFSHSIVSDSLWPHGLQHARLRCPSPAPGACSNSPPLSWWCHPTISSSYIYIYNNCYIHTYITIIIYMYIKLSYHRISLCAQPTVLIRYPFRVICWGTPLQSISPGVRRPHFCPGSIFAKWPWLSHSFWSLSPCRWRKRGPTEVYESDYELQTHANIGHYFHNFMSALQDIKRYISWY